MPVDGVKMVLLKQDHDTFDFAISVLPGLISKGTGER
jgi:hypothetical protein